MEKSPFQFKQFKIIRSTIERKEEVSSQDIKIGFNPQGIVDTAKKTFQLILDVKVEDQNESFFIEIRAVANYLFDDRNISKETLDSLFYVNAPALLFPYIRAYISTLTNLSGFEAINLPTMNMINLGEELKANTSTV
jgi:preprotein translocase subunit SecB